MADTRNRARIDIPLTNVSRLQKSVGLISEEVLTDIVSGPDSGLIGKYGKDHLRIVHDIVGGDNPYPRVDVVTKSTDRYQIEWHGLSIVVTARQKANEIMPFDALKDATMTIESKLRLGKEIALSSELTNVATLTQNTTLTGTDQFNDYDNSDPMGVFNDGGNAIFEGSGQVLEFGPDGLGIVPWQVFNKLRRHPQILESTKYVENKKKGVTSSELAAAMGVGRILIPFARVNNAKEGQTDVLAPIWGKDIIMAYAPKTGTKEMETLGFHITPRTGKERVFKNMIKNPPNADEILVDKAYDFFLANVGCAYLIKNAIA